MTLRSLYNLAISEVEFKGLPKPDTSEAQIQIVVNFIFGLAGALTLLFIVIGGLKYILSQGDPNATAQAKNTIIYAVVGLIVTVIAYAIVRFVVSMIS